MFLREQSEDQVDLRVSLSQLKKIYLGLFRQLHQSTPANFDEFDEDDMLSTLQNYLQRRAAAAGIDGTDHAKWDAFLGVVDAPSCGERRTHRRPPD